KLIDSMSRRVAEVIRATGGYITDHNYRDCVDQTESQKSVLMSHQIKIAIYAHDDISFPRYRELK
ncbi:hypothetical protein BDR06DRAFT_874290, partial [Suillus hirtellus]